jgi:uncharacterized protein
MSEDGPTTQPRDDAFVPASDDWTPADLARLEALLHAPPLAQQALTADALQGLFVAIAMGPGDVEAEHWITAALGETVDNGEAGPGVPVTPELVERMDRFRRATARSLADGSLAPLLYTLRSGRPDYATWCQGFLLGSDLAPVDWYDAADPDDIAELLFPVRVLGEALDDAERAAYAPAAWRKLVHDSQSGFHESLMRLRDYWAIVRQPPVTVRHAQPKVGRNEPCPCGSGRKYKQCCGR